MSRPAESLANPRLWLAFATMLLISGFPNSYVLFLPPLLEEFHASRAALASPLSFTWIAAAGLGPVAGWLVARRNPRLVVMTGLAVTAAGLLLGAQARSLSFMVLAVGITVGLGLGLTGLSTQAALLADTYSRRRGLAMGIAFSGAMAAYMLSPITQRLIGLIGWRGAFVCHAAAALALVPVAWRVLPARLGGRTPSAGPAATAPRERSLGRIVLSVPFWSLMVVFTVPPLFGSLATTQHALYFPARGFTPAEASLMLGAGGILAASGRILAGLLADRVGAPVAGLVSFSLSTMGVLCLLAMEAWPSRAFAYGYVLFLFLPLGSRATIVSVLLGRITGPRSYGPIFGLLGIGNSLGSATGPWLSGTIFDRTHSYLSLYLTTLVVAATGLSALVVFLLTVRQPAWERDDVSSPAA
ncbi:MAG TPA: MFS transporter [Candidatus Bathyarchaeia archaeon]|nr:MFS transporter [Candidatus Bathyarchaeia archaeon]